MKKRKYIYVGIGSAILTIPLLGSVLAYSCTSDKNNDEDVDEKISIDIDTFYASVKKYVKENISSDMFQDSNDVLKKEINKLLNQALNGASIGSSYNVLLNESNVGSIQFIINLPNGKQWSDFDIINVDTENIVFDKTNGIIKLNNIETKTLPSVPTPIDLDKFYLNVKNYVKDNIDSTKFVTSDADLKNKIDELLGQAFTGATIGNTYIVTPSSSSNEIKFTIKLPSDKKLDDSSIAVINTDTTNIVIEKTTNTITFKNLTLKVINNGHQPGEENGEDHVELFNVDLNTLYNQLNTFSTSTYVAAWKNDNKNNYDNVQTIVKKFFPSPIVINSLVLENKTNNSKILNLTISYTYDKTKYNVVLQNKPENIDFDNETIKIHNLTFNKATQVLVNATNFYSSINKITPYYSNTFINEKGQNNTLSNKLIEIFNQNCNQNNLNKPQITVKTITYDTNRHGLLFEFNIDPSLNFSLDNISSNVELIGFDKILVKNLNFWNSESLNTPQLTPEQIAEKNKFLTTQDSNSIGTFQSKITKTFPRNIQTKYYQTELWTKYHDTYGFIYPGWNRNYEEKNNRYFYRNWFDYINATDLVYNEVVPDSTDIRYSDTNWIETQIKNNNLLRHPAATNFFETDIDAIPNAVEKEFTISTGITGAEPLGLFVPAGEIVTITFDDQTFDLMKKNNYHGISFVINDNLWDNRQPGDRGEISNRYPFVKTEFNVCVDQNNSERNSVIIDPETRSIKIGTPFGGGLILDIQTTLSDNPVIHYSQPIKFKVAGAIPCLFYQDGVTTEKDWDYQVDQALKGELGPVIQATSGFFSLQISSSKKINMEMMI